MRKAILISIKPEWVAKILNGEKTLEIRKTIPKCDLPIDVYIYCTKGPGYCHHAFNAFRSSDNKAVIPMQLCNGKVVAKFTLNKVEEIKKVWYVSAFTKQKTISCYRGDKNGLIRKQLEEKSCLSLLELKSYIGWDKGYAWHIDNLEIFDKPKELREFYVYSYSVSGIGLDGEDKTFEILKPLTKAPQSYCYIKDVL